MGQQSVRAIIARPVVVSHVASSLPRRAPAARWVGIIAGRHYCRRAAANASAAENSLPTGKTAGRLPEAGAKPLKSAGFARYGGKRAGNCGKPNREAVATSRETGRVCMEVSDPIIRKRQLRNYIRHAPPR